MPAYDDLESHGGGIKIERVNVVKDVYRGAIHLDDFCLGQSERPRFRIDISPHGENRRESFQRFEDLRSSYIARMNDQFRAFQRAQGLGAQQPMRV
jgi:hypothetical protein